MFISAELETEARKAGLTTWRYQLDDDKEKFMMEIIEDAQSSLYIHNPSINCSDIGK